MTVSPRERLPTARGRQTQAAIDAAAGIEHAQQDCYCADDDSKLTAPDLVSMLVDDEAAPT